MKIITDDDLRENYTILEKLPSGDEFVRATVVLYDQHIPEQMIHIRQYLEELKSR